MYEEKSVVALFWSYFWHFLCGLWVGDGRREGGRLDVDGTTYEDMK